MGDEMGGACSTCGREEKRTQGFGAGTSLKDTLSDLGIDGWIILK